MTTKKSNLFIPEVVADQIATEYGNSIVVSNYFVTDTTLVGNAGDTLSFPQYKYVGDAEIVAEGEDITPKTLTSGKVDAKVVKVVNQVELSDEALNSGYGNPYSEAVTQIARSIAIKDDKDAVACLNGATYTTQGATLDKAVLNGMKVLGEKTLSNKVYVFANTKDYYDMLGSKEFIPASQMLAEKVTKGIVGEYLGALVIPTDTVEAKKPILMVEGAGRKVMKANFTAEQDRDLSNHTWLIDGSEHRVMYLYRDNYVCKLTISA